MMRTFSRRKDKLEAEMKETRSRLTSIKALIKDNSAKVVLCLSYFDEFILMSTSLAVKSNVLIYSKSCSYYSLMICILCLNHQRIVLFILGIRPILFDPEHQFSCFEYSTGTKPWLESTHKVKALPFVTNDNE